MPALDASAPSSPRVRHEAAVKPKEVLDEVACAPASDLVLLMEFATALDMAKECSSVVQFSCVILNENLVYPPAASSWTVDAKCDTLAVKVEPTHPIASRGILVGRFRKVPQIFTQRPRPGDGKLDSGRQFGLVAGRGSHA